MLQDNSKSKFVNPISIIRFASFIPFTKQNVILLFVVMSKTSDKTVMQIMDIRANKPDTM